MNGGVHRVREQDFAFKSTSLANSLPSVYLPEAPAAVVRALYSGRKSIHELLGDKAVLSFGDRMMATSWFNKADRIFCEAMEKAAVYDPAS